MENFYSILGVNRNASQLEIKKAYRQLAVRYHPDKNPGDKSAEQKMQGLNAAYAILSDIDLRIKYDRDLDYSAGKTAGSSYTQSKTSSSRPSGTGGWSYNFNDPTDPRNFEHTSWQDVWSDNFFNFRDFEDAFGLNHYDHLIEMTLTIADAISGAKKVIRYAKTEWCQECPHPVSFNCTCSGFSAGRKTYQCIQQYASFAPSRNYYSGQLYMIPQVILEKPAGTYHDLYIRIQVPFNLEQPVGDIEMQFEVPLNKAYYGGEHKVKAPSGALKVTIPTRSFTGKVLRVPGRGMKDPFSGQMTDLYLICKVVFPVYPTNLERLQINELMNIQKTQR